MKKASPNSSWSRPKSNQSQVRQFQFFLQITNQKQRVRVAASVDLG
jgi:hypothetical protein